MKTALRRFGMYYRPDTAHYRQADLAAYLPVLQRMGAAWLVVRSTATRAIPEAFLRGLRHAGIAPFVHFVMPRHTPAQEIAPLLHAYARWGVRHVAFFDRPNRRAFWEEDWRMSDLPARFVDIFLPLAASALAVGLQPFFPPLSPGGDYWDLAFLRAALANLRRRDADLAARIGIGAYAWSEGRPLDWGRGGPEIWPQAQPYATPTGSEDHRGFRIFEWYTVEARAALERIPPIFLLGMGSRYGHEPDDAVEAKNTAIARLFWSNDLPVSVMGGAFWVLAASAEAPAAPSAWVPPSGRPRPLVAALQTMAAEHSPEPRPAASAHHAPSSGSVAPRHYVLLPTFPAGLPPEYLSAAFPWLQGGQATLGFRLDEALQAERLTVLGRPEDYPPEVQQALQRRTPPPQWLPLPGTPVAPVSSSPHPSEAMP